MKILLLWILAPVLGAALAAAAFCLLTFVLTRLGEKRVGAGPGRLMAAAILRELPVQFLFFVFMLGKMAFGPKRERPGEGANPVILLPGYLETGLAFAAIRSELERQGLTCVVFSQPCFRDLQDQCDRLERFAHDLLLRPDAQRLHLVGHSMGGLLARQLALRLGPHKVGRVVSIACPHRGTRWAWAGVGRNSRQMAPRSNYLRELEIRPPAKGLLNIRTAHDNLISPRLNAAMGPADVVIESGWGHNGVLFAEETIESVLLHLNSTPSGQPAPLLQQTDRSIKL